MNDFNDHRLVHEFLATGSEAAFRTLYRRHTPALFAVVVRLLGGNTAEAEDVIQESWVRAAQKLDGFEWRSTLRTWLTGIALNCARNRYRTNAREAERHTEVTELPVATPMERNIEVIELERAVAQLPQGYREVLLLHDVYGYTHEEVGEILGIESGTSKSQLSRARSTLRRRLSETGDGNLEQRS